MRSPRTAMESSPHSPQLEKARAEQRRPNAAKTKQNKNLGTSLVVQQVRLFAPNAGGLGN